MLADFSNASVVGTGTFFVVLVIGPLVLMCVVDLVAEFVDDVIGTVVEASVAVEAVGVAVEAVGEVVDSVEVVCSVVVTASVVVLVSDVVVGEV